MSEGLTGRPEAEWMSNPKLPKRLIVGMAGVVLVGILLLICMAGLRELRRHHQAENVAREIEQLGGRVHWNPEIYETIFRDAAFSRITDVHIDDPSFPDEGLLILQQLPQRFGLQVSGPQFSDASLNYLKKAPHLAYLVVVDTNATDEGLSQLKRTLPHIEIMHGYYGDPDYRVVR